MKNPIRRIENSTCKEVVSPEFKKQVELKFSEKTSPLREERIKEVKSQLKNGVPGYLNISDALDVARDFLVNRGKEPLEEEVISIASDWLEDKSPEEYNNIEQAVREFVNKNRTAQVQPISEIQPKQPISDKQKILERMKKKEEPKGNFGEMLKESLPMEKEGTIVQENGKYCVKSHTGKNLGCSDTHEGALKRLRQVEFFKHKGQVSGEKAPIPCRNCNSQNTKYWTEQGLGGVNTGIECADCGWGSPSWIETHQNA